MHNMHTGAVPWPAVYSQVLVPHPDHDGAHNELDEGVSLLRGAAVLLHLLHVELLHGAGVVTVVVTLYFMTPCVRAEVRAASEARRPGGGRQSAGTVEISTLCTPHQTPPLCNVFCFCNSTQPGLQMIELDECFLCFKRKRKRYI